MDTEEQILGEADFQIIDEKELVKMKEGNTDTSDDEIIEILKESGVYDQLDEEMKEKLNTL